MKDDHIPPGPDSPAEDSSVDTSGSLRNQFLIATANLDSGIFKSSVTYICEHNEDGAMGIIINRPSTMCVEDILEDIFQDENSEEIDTASEREKEETDNKSPVMVGGPVGLERGFVLHELDDDASKWSSSLQVTSDIALTGSRDILQAMKEGKGPDKYLVVLGYAGWSPGQLEQELAENAWITAPASSEILFSTPFQDRAKAAVASLGIDLSSLATSAGNA